MLKRFFWFGLLALSVYGGGRFYFYATDGFAVDNIKSDFSYDKRWEVRELSSEEKTHVNTVLAQEFTYLGKGCQSYVFASADGKYVIKFFKYQRFRPKSWDNFFAFIPAVEQHRQAKIARKRQKLDRLFSSCCVAFENLKEETGLIFVHLNKTGLLGKRLKLHDKLGRPFEVKLDEMEFFVQKRATMICPAIEALMQRGEVEQAKLVITNFLDLVLAEYARGFADNDHALMQNTGVFEGKPIHVDVGQFVKNNDVKNPEVYHQQLFNKTYKFRIWLYQTYPELFDFLDNELQTIIGDSFLKMEALHLDKSERGFKPKQI